MESELIFNYIYTFFNRDAETEGYEVGISADFSDPTKWPFTLKRYEIFEDPDSYAELRNLTEEIRLPKDVFSGVKKIISSHPELASCDDRIENGRGGVDELIFKGDTFSKSISGPSILSIGSYEAEELPEEKRTERYLIYTVVQEISDYLNGKGIRLGV